MSKKYFSEGMQVGLKFMVLVLMAVSAVSYSLYGPYFSPDTVNYFHFSIHFFINNPWKEIYSPVYPFLLHCLDSLPFLSLFTAANFLVLIQYVLGLFFLVQLATNISNNHQFGSKGRLTLVLLFMTTYHTWWSFRIISWAHADAFFYSLLIAWAYYLAKYCQTNTLKNRLVFSFLGAILIWVKLNGLILVPYFILLLLLDKKKSRWLIPLFFIAVSFFIYRIVFPKNLLEASYQSSPIFNVSLQKNLEITGNNLAEFFKVTLGFFLSDVATATLPHFLAILGGFLTLILLILLARKEIKKGKGLLSLLILFGLVYLLCLLAFQQMALFEEINYRTLYPFFLPCSWYLWVKLIEFGKNSWLPILVLSFLMTSHSVIGHLYLWKRQDVNSLFEVGRLMQGEMTAKIQSLQSKTALKEVRFISDQPEKIALLLINPHVAHYNPDSYFIRGKIRPINPTERQKNLDLNKEKLLKGEVVLVLFKEDENIGEFARENGLVKLIYPDGTVLMKPLDP